MLDRLADRAICGPVYNWLIRLNMLSHLDFSIFGTLDRGTGGLTGVGRG